MLFSIWKLERILLTEVFREHDHICTFPVQRVGSFAASLGSISNLSLDILVSCHHLLVTSNQTHTRKSIVLNLCNLGFSRQHKEYQGIHYLFNSLGIHFLLFDNTNGFGCFSLLPDMMILSQLSCYEGHEHCHGSPKPNNALLLLEGRDKKNFSFS